MSSAIAALVIGHADFASGLVSAVAQITGRGDQLLALSNRDLSAEALEARIRDLLSSTGARVVFTDLPAGSPTIAARKALRDDPSVVIVAGANLATVLDFLMQTGAYGREAAVHAAGRGRTAIVVVGAPRAG